MAEAIPTPAAVLVWAHQGNLEPPGSGDADAPEGNSEAAFARASEAGVDGVELDTWLTADGHFVVHHDQTIHLGQLDKLREDQLPAELPTLAEAVGASRVATVNIELKTPPDATDSERERLGRTLGNTLGRPGHLVVSSFDLVALNAVRADRPDLRTGFLTTAMPDAETLAALHKRGHWGVHLRFDQLDQAAIDGLREAGLAVVAWTVNDDGELTRLLDAAVDVIITDASRRALELRAGH